MFVIVDRNFLYKENDGGGRIYFIKLLKEVFLIK